VRASGTRFWWVAVVVVFAMQAHAAQGPRARDEQDAMAMSPEADAAYGPDLRGHRIADDVRELVGQINREGTAPAGGTLIPDGTNLSGDQRARAAVLFQYWALYPALTVNREVWNSFLERNQLPATTAHSADVLAAEAAMQSKLESGKISKEWIDLGRKLLAAYVDERIKVARNTDVSGVPVPRAAACPAVTSKLSPNAWPKLERAPRSLAEFWPEQARKRGEEGLVMVMLHVTATGCAESAWVSASSGFPDLDQAAAKFYETLTFLPAQQNGAAVAADVTLPVRFKLEGIGTR
jgi:TonB family protein